jgi:predicted DNA-binding transcriptional regulator AlpA
MKKEEFAELYHTLSLDELKAILNVSIPTIYKRIEEYDIPKKGQGKGKRSTRKLDLE